MLEVFKSDSYNWISAFDEANYGGVRNANPLDTVDLSPVRIEDVAQVFGSEEGENDGPSWVCCGLLKDGRAFFMEAGCDYTGWDCQAGGSITVAPTFGVLQRHGMTRNDMHRMGIKDGTGPE